MHLLFQFQDLFIQLFGVLVQKVRIHVDAFILQVGQRQNQGALSRRIASETPSFQAGRQVFFSCKVMSASSAAYSFLLSPHLSRMVSCPLPFYQ